MRSLRIWIRLLVDELNGFFHKIARKLIRKVVEIAFTDFDLARYFNDPTGIAAFEEKHLTDVPFWKDRGRLFASLMKLTASDDGLFLEFGVYKGNSINRLAALKPGVIFHGFDSFIGLPEAWNAAARKGAFDVGGRLPPVRRNVRLIRGFYEDTLSAFVAANATKSISFMHIDCDLYSSTKTVLEHTRSLLQPGTIILFDEYLGGSYWQLHEHKAFTEFVAENNIRFEYIGYVRHQSQVAVRLL